MVPQKPGCPLILVWLLQVPGPVLRGDASLSHDTIAVLGFVAIRVWIDAGVPPVSTSFSTANGVDFFGGLRHIGDGRRNEVIISFDNLVADGLMGYLETG